MCPKALTKTVACPPAQQTNERLRRSGVSSIVDVDEFMRSLSRGAAVGGTPKLGSAKLLWSRSYWRVAIGSFGSTV